jgi:hypothetical protein
LVALDAIPAKSRTDVAKAALGIIKEGMARRKDVARQEAATAKLSKKPVAAKRAAPRPAAKPATKGGVPKGKNTPVRKPQAGKPKLTVVPKTAVA